MPVVGLRFRRGEARKLDALADEFARRGVAGTSLYRAAADSTRAGEPLLVECEAPGEAQQMAAGFAALGVRRPAVEPLSGGTGGTPAGV